MPTLDEFKEFLEANPGEWQNCSKCGSLREPSIRDGDPTLMCPNWESHIAESKTVNVDG